MMSALPSAAAHLGYEQPRLGSGIPYSVPRGHLPVRATASGSRSPRRPSRSRTACSTLLGLGDDPRFATFESRGRAPRGARRDRRRRGSARGRSAEVLAAFDAVEAAIAPVYSMRELLADPHVRARDVFVEVDGVVMQGPVARLSRTPGEMRCAGRALGADTEAVLRRARRPLTALAACPPAGRSCSRGPQPAGSASGPCCGDSFGRFFVTGSAAGRCRGRRSGRGFGGWWRTGSVGSRVPGSTRRRRVLPRWSCVRAGEWRWRLACGIRCGTGGCRMGGRRSWRSTRSVRRCSSGRRSSTRRSRRSWSELAEVRTALAELRVDDVAAGRSEGHRARVSA